MISSWHLALNLSAVMLSLGFLLVFCILGAHSAAVKDEKVSCNELYYSSRLSEKFNETIAHTIHSMTVQGLRMFNPKATVENNVPTVNHDISDESHLVLPYAPAEHHMGENFTTNTMNMIDVILSRIGKDDDGLGPNWSATERIVHKFHMYDVWSRVLITYKKTVLKDHPQDELCECLLNTHENGIYDAVHWVAQHYKSGTPITLLNRPIPKLKDAKSWGIWKKRLLHYYTNSALEDASIYLYCATKHFGEIGIF